MELSQLLTSITNMKDAPEVCFVLVSVGLDAAMTVKPSPPRRTGSTWKSSFAAVAAAERMNEVRRVDVAPLPGVHVVAEAFPQVGDRLLERLREDAVATLGGIGAERAIRLLHPGDDAPHVVLPDARPRLLGHFRRERERPELERPEFVDRRRHGLAVEDEVPREQALPRLLRRGVGHGRTLQAAARARAPAATACPAAAAPCRMR